MSEHPSVNLKLLCSRYHSISGVCRQLAISYAQFNGYLSSQSQPTPCSRKRVGGSFGIKDYELDLPPEQFARLVGARASARPHQFNNGPLLQLLQPLRAETGDLGRYCDYYFEHTNCMSVPGNILLSLVHLYEGDGVFLFERQERQERTSSTDVQTEEQARCRYLGAAFQLQDRVFLIDYESLTLNEMSQTIPIPNFKSHITRLNGLKMGVSSSDRRTPACSQAVWEYLGVGINRINTYRQVRPYRPNDPRINEDIRRHLAVGSLRHGLPGTG